MSARWQAMRFLVAGGGATLTDALLYLGLTGQGLDARLSNILSYGGSAILAFLLHRHWTFRAREGVLLSQGGRFVLMVLAGLVLSTLLVWLFATLIGAVPAKGLAICATLCLNFLVSRLFVFAAPGRS